MAYDCSLEEERLQKKLIPLNIVVCVLCMVAIISLLVAPLFTFNVGDFLRAVGDTADGIESGSGSGESGSGSGSGSSSSDINWKEAFDDVDLEISFTPINMGQIAFSGESTFDSFLDEIFVKSGLIESIIVPAANESCLEQLGVDYTNLDLSTLNEKFRALGEVHSEAEMLTAAAAWVDEINAVAPGSVDNVEKDATVQNMVDYYNKTIEATGGPYDLEKFVCVVASDGMESETVYTDYSSMVKSLMGQSTEGAGAAEELDTVLGAASKSLFGFVMFTIGVWFVLFLFSLLHIFAQNKRFMMWYVKLWGATPCFIFGVLPTFLAGLLKSTGDATVAAMAGIFTSLTTLTWISGACWLVLWLISIFWAFPIKRKIRADRKA